MHGTALCHIVKIQGTLLREHIVQENVFVHAGRDKRPIVEFALESAQAVRKMASKQAWQKSQAKAQGEC